MGNYAKGKAFQELGKRLSEMPDLLQELEKRKAEKQRKLAEKELNSLEEPTLSDVNSILNKYKLSGTAAGNELIKNFANRLEITEYEKQRPIREAERESKLAGYQREKEFAKPQEQMVGDYITRLKQRMGGGAIIGREGEIAPQVAKRIGTTGAQPTGVVGISPLAQEKIVSRRREELLQQTPEGMALVYQKKAIAEREAAAEEARRTRMMSLQELKNKQSEKLKMIDRETKIMIENMRKTGKMAEIEKRYSEAGKLLRAENLMKTYYTFLSKGIDPYMLAANPNIYEEVTQRYPIELFAEDYLSFNEKIDNLLKARGKDIFGEGYIQKEGEYKKSEVSGKITGETKPGFKTKTSEDISNKWNYWQGLSEANPAMQKEIQKEIDSGMKLNDLISNLEAAGVNPIPFLNQYKEFGGITPLVK